MSLLGGGRDLKSLVEEGKQLEQELRLIQAGQTTRERCDELVKFVQENQGHDPLVVKNPTGNAFQRRATKDPCCMFRC